MKHRAMIAAALVSWLAACTKDTGERRIIEAAKRDSIPYCSRSKDGCEFSILETADGWDVMVFPITRAENGDRVYIPGIFRSYSYDKNANLLRETPGV
jgi:hypothetical protein